MAAVGERGEYLTRNRAAGLARQLALAEGRLEGRIESLERQLAEVRGRNEQMRTLLLALTRKLKTMEMEGRK